MKQIIQNIRQQPEHQRNRIIWMIAAIVVALLLLLWVLIGNTKRESNGNVINELNSEYNENKNLLPDLYNKN